MARRPAASEQPGWQVWVGLVSSLEAEQVIGGAVVGLAWSTVRFESSAVTRRAHHARTGLGCRRHTANECECLRPVSSRISTVIGKVTADDMRATVASAMPPTKRLLTARSLESNDYEVDFFARSPPTRFRVFPIATCASSCWP